MTKYKLEYIWLDGKTPIAELRGKTLLKTFEHPPTLADLPTCGFDGSSTQARPNATTVGKRLAVSCGLLRFQGPAQAVCESRTRGSI